MSTDVYERLRKAWSLLPLDSEQRDMLEKMIAKMTPEEAEKKIKEAEEFKARLSGLKEKLDEVEELLKPVTEAEDLAKKK